MAITTTVAIPTLNEAAAIRPCLADLLSQTDPETTEILVLDGGSADGTREIVAALAAETPRLRLVPNPKRLQAAALNLAAVEAAPTARALVRADAHARYPAGFVDAMLAALATTGADSVVSRMRAEGESCFQRAAAAAQNGPVGNGGAAHRGASGSGWVEHGHHAAFDLAAFRRIGGYDEAFSHNEDAEFDIRLRAAGGRIWLCADPPVIYRPRPRPGALLRQYYNHGRGRGRTLAKHRRRPALRQAAPPLAVGGALAGAALAAAQPAFAAVPALYAAACCAPGAVAAARSGERCRLALGPAAILMHAGWSAGFLRSLAEGARGLRDAPSAAPRRA